MSSEIQRCTRCVMDTTDPWIRFDSGGICQYCHLHDRLEQEYPLDSSGEDVFYGIIDEIKRRGANKPYDCVIGVSGGTDSTYQLYLAKKLHLRPLVVHFDNGWDTEIAVSNIKNATEKLGFDLYTYVVNWEEFKNLQIAFLKASTPDCEIPTDIGIKATLYRAAAENDIQYIVNGHSFRTEGKVPIMWSYGDGRYIKSVQKIYGSMKLSSFPNFTLFDLFYYSYLKHIKQFRLLYYFPYNKKSIKELLKKELDWQDYGGHHYESVYTRFYQGYILPEKFGIDKRKREFSALIRSGQLGRRQALDILNNTAPMPKDQAKSDRIYVIKKLGLSNDEFFDIMRQKPRSFLEFPNYYNILKRYRTVITSLYKLVSHSTPPILMEMEPSCHANVSSQVKTTH
ncbi:N-acetyl sugar amidotransferase [candidate division KSB1 bacterium]|nr:N-acetyl sugar amidotransferase [candidate division KSB1 bacterium]